MSKVTKAEFRAAMIIVENYCMQVETKPALKIHEIGCRVRLSAFGRKMQRPHNRKGVVVDWLEWHGKEDGVVTVKWEGLKRPQSMHISQVEPIK